MVDSIKVLWWGRLCCSGFERYSTGALGKDAIKAKLPECFKTFSSSLKFTVISANSAERQELKGFTHDENFVEVSIIEFREHRNTS